MIGIVLDVKTNEGEEKPLESCQVPLVAGSRMYVSLQSNAQS